jgi:ribosome-associated heat shock protein Hsp15
MTQQPGQLDTIRLDKWLWAARFFKTRSLAAQAVTGGKVQVNEQRAKAGKIVGPGIRLRIRKGSVEWDVIIKQVTRHRRPATEAVLLYEETPESVEQRRLESERRRSQREERDMDPGRPSKRQRRNLMQLKRS